MRIAFFDSGLGGITVLHKAIKQLPKEQFLYFADTLHVPYGTKSRDEVKRHVKNAVDTIIKEDVKALVIACNTATSIAAAELRSAYDIPIIGMEPAVKPAVEMNRSSGKRVLVFATQLTLSQSNYAQLISRTDDKGIVDSLPLPELVELCERLNFDSRTVEDYFKAKLSGFDLSAYGTVVLGCTHYPFYKRLLSGILPGHIQIIDGSAGTVKRLIQVLESSGQLNALGSTDISFMCSNQDQAYVRKMEQALEIIRTEG